MKSFLQIWVYSNIHIALIAFLLSLESNYLLGISDDYKSPLFVFFSTLFIYNLGYYRTILFNDEAQRYHADWMKKHVGYWIFSMLISLIAIIYLFSSYTLNAQIIIVVLSFISILYIIHDVNIYGFRLSIRNIPYIKTIIVSAIWVLITLMPQLIDHNLIEVKEMWVPIMMEHFFFILPITLMFDIRDLNSDPDYLLTIPRLLGSKTTKVIAALSLFTGFYFLLKIELPTLGYWEMLTLYLVMLTTVFYSDSKRGEMYYSAWFDGLIGIHAIIIIAQFIA